MPSSCNSCDQTSQNYLSCVNQYPKVIDKVGSTESDNLYPKIEMNINEFQSIVWSSVKYKLEGIFKGRMGLYFYNPEKFSFQKVTNDCEVQGKTLIEEAVSSNKRLLDLTPKQKKEVMLKLENMALSLRDMVFEHEKVTNNSLQQQRVYIKGLQNNLLSSGRCPDISYYSTNHMYVRSVIEASAAWAKGYAETSLRRLGNYHLADDSNNHELRNEVESLKKLKEAALSVLKVDCHVYFENLIKNLDLQSFFLGIKPSETIYAQVPRPDFYSISGELVKTESQGPIPEVSVLSSYLENLVAGSVQMPMFPYDQYASYSMYPQSYGVFPIPPEEVEFEKLDSTPGATDNGEGENLGAVEEERYLRMRGKRLEDNEIDGPSVSEQNKLK